MKLPSLSNSLVAGLLAVTLSGCDKNTSSTAVDNAKSNVQSATPAAPPAVEKTVAEVKSAAEKVVAEAKPAVAKAVQAVAEPLKPASSEVAGIIAKSQSLVAEKKYTEALTSLVSLKDAKLTDSQKKMVDELKGQISKLMSGDTGKAIGNLLGK